MKIFGVLIVVLSLFLLSGCYSFFRINTDDYKTIKENDAIKVELKNGDQLKISDIRETRLTENQLEVTDKYSRRSIFLLQDVKKISLEEFDAPKTMLTPLFICFGVIGVFILLGGRMSPGG